MKTNYIDKKFNNPIAQIDNLIDQAHTLKVKQKFIDRFGEDPVDVLGNDWENYIEVYMEEVNDEEFMIDRL